VNLFRTLLFWLLLAIAGAVLAQFLLRDPGFVQVRYLGTTVEMTLVGLALMAVAAALALWLLWQALGWPLRLWRRRRERAARAVLAEGLDALHHGRWVDAEAILLRAAQDPVFATPARIGAARAAAARGDAAAANAHLDAIAATQPAARAIALAEIALADGRPDDALAALEAVSGAAVSPRMQALRVDALAAQRSAATAPDAPLVPSPPGAGD
jgi:HemY protein